MCWFSYQDDADLADLISISTDYDEIQLVLNFLAGYILQHGRSRTIYFKNPIVWCALSKLCTQCKIKLEISKLLLVDEYIASFHDIL